MNRERTAEQDARERLRMETEGRLRELRFRLRPREMLSDARDAALSRAEPIAEAVIDGLSARRTEAVAAAGIVGLAGVGVALLRGKSANAPADRRPEATTIEDVRSMPAPDPGAIGRFAKIVGAGLAIGAAIGYAVRVTPAERRAIAAARRDLTDLAAREFDRRLREASSASAVRANALNLALAALATLRAP
jgi:hypothetical protein